MNSDTDKLFHQDIWNFFSLTGALDLIVDAISPLKLVADSISSVINYKVCVGPTTFFAWGKDVGKALEDAGEAVGGYEKWPAC